MVGLREEEAEEETPEGNRPKEKKKKIPLFTEKQHKKGYCKKKTE